jgi:hypothetical protein
MNNYLNYVDGDVTDQLRLLVMSKASNGTR